MNDSGRQQLMDELCSLSEQAEENVCGMPDFVMGSIAKALHALASSQYKREVSKEEVAMHFDVTTKTIDRWIIEKGFPKGRRNGHKELLFPVDEISKWKRHQQND